MQGNVDEAELTIGYMHLFCARSCSQAKAMSQSATVIPSISRSPYLCRVFLRNGIGPDELSNQVRRVSATRDEAQESLRWSLSGRKVRRLETRVLARRDHGDLMALTCACRSCHTYENATLEEACGGRGAATGDYCMSDYSGQSQPAPEEGWRNCYLGRGARVPAESSPLALSVGAC